MAASLPHTPGLTVRRVGAAGRPAVQALLEVDPIVNSALIARLEITGLAGATGEFWGAYRGPELAGVVYAGGNVVPAATSVEPITSIARQLARQPRRALSIVGPVALVSALWRELDSSWGPARSVRASQPMLIVDRAAQLNQSGQRLGLRVAGIPDVDDLFEPTVDMFTEEVGISPLATTTSATYRARLAWLVRQRRVLFASDTRGVVFKAEISLVTADTCQIQGVWVRPDMRGRGLGTAAMRSVTEYGLTLAPIVSLYVNDYNTAALCAYRRAGFRPIATMSTVHL